MKRLPFLLLFAACSDPTTPPIEEVLPCTSTCEGLNLSIDSIRVVLPSLSNDGKPLVYSGDTIAVVIDLTNRGQIVPDTITTLIVKTPQTSVYIRVNVGRLQPGAHKQYIVKFEYPPFVVPSSTRDSVRIELNRSSPDVYVPFAERITSGFAVVPATLEIIDVPNPLRWGGNQSAQIRIRNPGPHPIKADSVLLFTFDFDIAVGRFKKQPVRAILPGETATFTLPLVADLSDPGLRPWDQWANKPFVVCYYGRCVGQQTTQLPDFEGMCLVRRLVPQVRATATIGRCIRDTLRSGPGQLSLDVSSFDALQGQTVEIKTTQTAPVGFELRASDGARIAQLFATQRVTVPSTGRYYILASGRDSDYTVRVDIVQ